MISRIFRGLGNSGGAGMSSKNDKAVTKDISRTIATTRPGPVVAPDDVDANPSMFELMSRPESRLLRTILRHIDALEPVPAELLRLAFEQAEEDRCSRLEEKRLALLELREAYAESARLLLPEKLSDGGK